MNVASRELSKELYDLSGWYDEYSPKFYEAGGGNDYSGYTLGYLLRKLPASTYTSIGKLKDDSYNAICEGDKSRWVYRADADTPEDAACKLAIELFKNGILKPEGEKRKCEICGDEFTITDGRQNKKRICDKPECKTAKQRQSGNTLRNINPRLQRYLQNLSFFQVMKSLPRRSRVGAQKLNCPAHLSTPALPGTMLRIEGGVNYG